MAALGRTQREILTGLKRQGSLTVAALAAQSDLHIETIRGHLRTLTRLGMVRRAGRVVTGPGRPEVVYALTELAEADFPRREAETLRELAGHLVATGHSDRLQEFFAHRITHLRATLAGRLDHLSGEARLAAIAGYLTESGFMATVESDGATLRLRLCHCPIREMIHATRIPCLAEEGLIRDLVGEELVRESYIPAGDSSCCYRVVQTAPAEKEPS